MSEFAKRRPPEVPPVEVGGVRYEVPRAPRALGHAQASGVLAAVSPATGDVLWSIVVYPITYAGSEEEDAQDIFITAIEPEEGGESLVVTSENAARYRVHIADHSVEPLP